MKLIDKEIILTKDILNIQQRYNLQDFYEELYESIGSIFDRTEDELIEEFAKREELTIDLVKFVIYREYEFKVTPRRNSELAFRLGLFKKKHVKFDLDKAINEYYPHCISMFKTGLEYFIKCEYPNQIKSYLDFAKAVNDYNNLEISGDLNE